jgi:hypothetical protein
MNQMILFLSLLVIPFSLTNASTELIKQMAGCYKVAFNFAEYFPQKEDIQVLPEYHETALEWIEVTEEAPGEVYLQHVLQVGPRAAIKHWGQWWRQGVEAVWTYQGKNKWVKKSVEENQYWSQFVFQVDDTPRYECRAPWISWEDKNYWECESPAPLPRREFKNRPDYDILLRQNRHQVSSLGHIHSHDARKLRLIESGGVENLIFEKGMNTYTRISDESCSVAQKTWEEMKTFWSIVRSEWMKVYQDFASITKQSNNGFFGSEVNKLYLENKERPMDEKLLRASIQVLIQKHYSLE